MKKILVAGGAGFIGTNLINFLLKKGDFVICMDNFYSSDKKNIQQFEKFENFNFINHDIIDKNFPIMHVDEIYNLACPASPPSYQKDPIFTSKTSFIGSINLLELAVKNNSKYFFASTSEIYGDPIQHPQNENYLGNVNPIGPRSCYDEGKRLAESITYDFHRRFNLDIKIVRIFNTYGPFMSPFDGRVVSNFIVKALKNDTIEIYGDGSQTRSFCYITDLVDGFEKLMKKQIGFSGPLNLGNDHEVTINELAKIIIGLTNSNSRIVSKDLPLDDPKIRRPDISLANQTLSWKPKVGLQEGLLKTIDYFRKNS